MPPIELIDDVLLEEGEEPRTQSTWPDFHLNKTKIHTLFDVKVILWKAVVCFLLFSIITTSLLRFANLKGLWRPVTIPYLSTTPDDLDLAIRLLYHPILHDYTSPFRATNGELFTTPPTHQWTSPLGRALCIVNVDSRPMNHSNQVWADGETHFDWSSIAGSQSGYLNHYVYSRIHGYRYLYVQATVPDGYVTAWARPGVFAHVFADESKGCKVLVYADSDVVIPNLRLPFEWLLNRWRVPRNMSMVAMSVEPDLGWQDLFDKKGKLGYNAGFIIMHNNGEGVIEEMLHKWRTCVSEVDYPGCAEFKGSWPAEQGAFNNYIRYDYPTMGLPCKEAFGWPSWDLCKGPLMTHYTMDKDAVHGGIESSLAHGVMEVVHKDMLAHKQDLFKFEDHILDALSE